MQTATGRSHRGRIGAVAEGFCSLEARGTTVVVATAALTVVRVPGGAVAPAAERAAPLALTFAEALARLAADRPRVLVATAGDPGGVRGELVAVGRDVLTLRADGDGASIHVRLGAVLEVVLV